MSLASLLCAIVVSVGTGRGIGQDLNDDRIDALQGSAAFDITAHMSGLGRTSQALAASPQAAEAIDAFASAHRQLLATPLIDLEEEVEAVLAHHQTNYIEALRSAGRDIQLRDVATANSASIYLQYHYAVELGVFDTPEAIDDASDGSDWSEVHRAVHPVYREVVERGSLVDLYLVEPNDATIVYSVRKRPDIGTSLQVGPFSGSALASIVERVASDPSRPVVVSDMSFYNASVSTPVGVVASPVMDGSRLAGVLVLMYDSTALTEILTASGNWDEAGFPPTGQTYLVASDGTLRSESRSFLEDAELHLEASVAAGLLNSSDMSFIEAAGTAVLTQRANGEAVLAGVQGDSSVEGRTNLIGTETLSATARVPVEGVEWFVVSEVERVAAEGDLADFEELLIVGTAIFIVALAFLAVAWANQTVRPVRAISERLASRSTEPIEVNSRSPLEFHRLAESFESMSSALQEQHDNLAKARAGRLDVLRRMLPPGVAARIADGEIQSLDEVPQATVVVMVVAGLGDVVDVDSARSDLALLDDILGELDELAERHGLERVKVMGDSYFAACGHDRPLIDHAPRVAAFATDAQNAVRDLGAATAGGLDVSAGIHTGSVTVGTIGGHRMLYDVWGETVSTAHMLAREALRGQILATEQSKSMLPESVETLPFAQNVWSIAGTGLEATP